MSFYKPQKLKRVLKIVIDGHQIGFFLMTHLHLREPGICLGKFAEGFLMGYKFSRWTVLQRFFETRVEHSHSLAYYVELFWMSAANHVIYMFSIEIRLILRDCHQYLVQPFLRKKTYLVLVISSGKASVQYTFLRTHIFDSVEQAQSLMKPALYVFLRLGL